MAKLVINENKTEGHINPEIYGHFSEHLGRCIYEGLYVKEDSGIPNVNGMRMDVVEALKEMQIPVLRWPMLCGRVSLERRYRAERKPQKDDQHALGRRCRGQQLRYARIF